jgi:hypothetical protein
MFCNQCGNSLPTGSRFCPSCGAPVVTVQEAPKAEKQQEPNQSHLPSLEHPAPVAPSQPVQKTGLSSHQRIGITCLVIGALGILFAMYGAQESVYLANGQAKDLAKYGNGPNPGFTSLDFNEMGCGAIAVAIFLLGSVYLFVTKLKNIYKTPMIQKEKIDLEVKKEQPEEIKERERLALIDQERTKTKLICWTCMHYQSSWYDRTAGKCVYHNKKTASWETCEFHALKEK